MKILFYPSKVLLLLISFSFMICSLTIAQSTTVTPVLTLNASGIVDQDDMCIWIHPTDNSLSTVISSDKSASKLFVYDISGNTLQTIDVPGKPGNIDIRYNFQLSGQPTDIVGYNDRDNGTMVFYKVNPDTRQLSFISNFSDGGMTGNNYGFTLYHSPNTGKYYAIASSKSTQMKQWELVDNGDGTIDGIFKRTWNNGSGDISEGMVADDEMGKLYCSNEGEGIYEYDADPIDSNPTGTLAAATGENGLTADVEGLTIYYAANGGGYLMASSQGSSNFKIYERKEPHNFVKTVVVTTSKSTDGIDISNINFGSAFPNGFFLSHDGSGSGPYPIRVSKYEDLDLIIDTEYWNPRSENVEPQLNLITPNGGEIWNVGEQKQITWNSQNVKDINIELSTDDGNSWISIANSISTANGVYIDTVQNFPSLFCRVKITDAANSALYDISDTSFTIDLASDVTEEYNNHIPNDYQLSQNYPNPFNPSTLISFGIPESGLVSLKIYNLLGEEVRTLINNFKTAGTYRIEFNGIGLPTGVYLYRLQTTSFVDTKKMLLIK